MIILPFLIISFSAFSLIAGQVELPRTCQQNYFPSIIAQDNLSLINCSILPNCEDLTGDGIIPTNKNCCCEAL